MNRPVAAGILPTVEPWLPARRTGKSRTRSTGSAIQAPTARFMASMRVQIFGYSFIMKLKRPKKTGSIDKAMRLNPGEIRKGFFAVFSGPKRRLFPGQTFPGQLGLDEVRGMLGRGIKAKVRKGIGQQAAAFHLI